MLLAAAALCIAVAYALWSKRRKQAFVFGEYPAYGVRETLLNPQEIAYYKTLARAIGDQYVAFPKVRLSDVLEHPGPNPQFRAHWFRVQRRTVDLLVCTLSLKPTLAVKFGSSAKRRGGRQDVLDDALEAAGLPLIRVKLSDSYDVEEVRYKFKFAMARSSEDSDLQGAEPGEAATDRAHDGNSGRPRSLFAAGRDAPAGGGFNKLRRWTSDLWMAARRQ